MPILHQLGAIYRFSAIPLGIDREALAAILVNAGLKVAKMEFFANERSANVIISDANPTTQEVARKAMRGRCYVDFIRANTHADINGFGSVASQVLANTIARLGKRVDQRRWKDCLGQIMLNPPYVKIFLSRNLILKS